jgi:hypothetical protein
VIDTELRALFDEVLQNEPLKTPTVDDDVARGRRLQHRRRRRIATAALGAAIVTAVTATALPGTLMRSADAPLGPSTETVTQIDANPFFLINDPAWTIMRAEIDDVKAAWYKRGSDRATISWYDVEDQTSSSLVQNREAALTEVSTTVLGRDGSIFILADGFELIWWDGATEISVRAQVGSLDEFQAVIDTVREVDAETWLSATERYAHDYDNVAAIAEIASNVPVPDSFPSLAEGRLDRIDPDDEQGLTEGTLHWVACAWVREWVDAERSSDRIDIRDQLSQVVDWAAEHDVRMDKTVWTSAQAITDGKWTVEGRSIADHAPEELRCGGW